MTIHFAPLQGYTEDSYRRFHNEIFGGVYRYYTPFLRLEHGKMRTKDIRDIRPEYNAGVDVVPQVIANGGEELEVLLGHVLPLGYRHVDVNMGCPFALQTRHGRGAGILPHADKVEEISACIASYPEISFSVKMRLGLDGSDEWRTILPILNDTPLTHVTLHPRIAVQQYRGEVDMDAFSCFLDSSSHPVIYNGDIRSIGDIRNLEGRYGGRLGGVMIGRGLLSRPSLGREYENGEVEDEKSLIHDILRLHDMMRAHYEKVVPGEAQRLMKLRTFWDYLEPTIGRKAWKKIVKAGNMKNYLSSVALLS